MYKFSLIYIFTSLLFMHPSFSHGNNLNTTLSTAFNSKNTLGLYNNLRTQNKSNINYNLNYSKKSFSTQFSLNFDDHDSLNFDNSYINYKKGIADLNIGKVDRIWSFSKKSSLLLSSNSRPLEVISIKLENKFNTRWLPTITNWSAELINGSTKNSLNGKNSMLSGARIIISPSEKLNFEFLQISQWGDQNDKIYSSNINHFLFRDTNEGKNSNVNKLAGFGLSYLVLLNENTYRFYGQAIGEDEAGSLPSCYSWLAGLELTAPGIKFPTTVTIEAIDTRVKKTSHGNCGQNTMYNNNYYDYINYDTVLGVPIDTEGTSLELYGESQISQKIDVEYSAKYFTINDKNWPRHRLASKRETGLINSVGISWNANNLKLGINIYNQDYILDKAAIKNSSGIGFFSKMKF
ncbi:capsule assembly Wzi family protein [Amylibacter sp.]|nr:capsule assembly Wzi family protein [Amylibacter sp.]